MHWVHQACVSSHFWIVFSEVLYLYGPDIPHDTDLVGRNGIVETQFFYWYPWVVFWPRKITIWDVNHRTQWAVVISVIHVSICQKWLARPWLEQSFWQMESTLRQQWWSAWQVEISLMTSEGESTSSSFTTGYLHSTQGAHQWYSCVTVNTLLTVH